uniref:FHA domain-containing protein n=1 Tax=Anopheles maculatus TaxID=74869 RepID=A0A182SKW0_9DIPT
MHPSDCYNFIGRLISKTNLLLISEHNVIVGSAAPQSGVDFQVADSKMISNKHFIVVYGNNKFFVLLLSKKGLYIDGIFHSKLNTLYKLPKSCCFQFPGTNVKMCFESLIDPVDLTPNIGLLVKRHMLPLFISNMLGRNYGIVLTESNVSAGCKRTENSQNHYTVDSSTMNLFLELVGSATIRNSRSESSAAGLE